MIYVKESSRMIRPIIGRGNKREKKPFPILRTTSELYNMYGQLPRSDITHVSRDCICDRCISEYMDLYEKIERLHDRLQGLNKKMSRSKRDKLNEIIHKKIKVRVKKKKS